MLLNSERHGRLNPMLLRMLMRRQNAGTRVVSSAANFNELDSPTNISTIRLSIAYFDKL